MFAVRVILIATLIARVLGCSNLLIGKDASETGSPQLAYTSDAAWQYGGVGHYAAARHAKGTMRQIFNEDTGAYAGEITEAAETYNVVGFHGGMNEHQLAISETTFGGLKSLSGQNGLIDYGTLMDLALQRCKTARQAIMFIDEITREYGYASSGESVSIADTKEVWLMELISKGAGETGIVWVARRIPDDSACSHANQARIRTWPRDDTSLWANDTVSFAQSKGLYPKDADPLAFSFSDTFHPVDFLGARLCEARVYNMLSQITRDATFATQYLDYAQGYNLTNRMPLFVKAKARGAVSVNDTAWLMRTRFQGTWFDETGLKTPDVGAGAYHAEYRASPLTWSSGGKKYISERTVSVQYNAFHFVAVPRADVPAPIGGVIWYGVDDQALSCRFPLYSASTTVPATWLEGPQQNRTVFKMRSSHWAFNLVANYAYSHWDAIFPYVQARIVAKEAQYGRDQAAMDVTAAEILKKSGASEALEALTAFGMRTGDALVEEWNALFGELFVRFSDGVNASAIPRPAPPPGSPAYTRGGTSTVSTEAMGYDEAWYARIVKDAGQKYHIPEGIEIMNPRLSEERLQFML